MIDEKLLNIICTEMLFILNIRILQLLVNQYGGYFYVYSFEKNVGKRCNYYLHEVGLDNVLIVHKESGRNVYRLHERDSAKKSDIDNIINLYKLKGVI